MNDTDVGAALAFAETLVQEAGRIALRHFRQPLDVTNKLGDGRFDPVTIAYRHVESFLVERIRARNVLRVGYIPDRLPFAFVNARGELVGMDVELAGRLAQDLGVASVEFVALRWDTLGEVVAEGRVDMVMSVPYVTELLPRARFSMPYFDGHVGFVVRDERRHDFSTLEQMRKLRRVTLGLMVEIPTLEVRLREHLAGVDVRFTVVDTSQGMPRELPAGISSGYSAATCVHAKCSRLRETAGPSEHLVPSGTAGFVPLWSRTSSQHCTRASPGFLGSNSAGPDSRRSPFAR